MPFAADTALCGARVASPASGQLITLHLSRSECVPMWAVIEAWEARTGALPVAGACRCCVVVVVVVVLVAVVGVGAAGAVRVVVGVCVSGGGGGEGGDV